MSLGPISATASKTEIEQQKLQRQLEAERRTREAKAEKQRIASLRGKYGAASTSDEGGGSIDTTPTDDAQSLYNRLTGKG